MEGGIIKNNKAHAVGGGFHTGSRGSFTKTGGIIYGRNAPKETRNIAIEGSSPPKIYGHAVSISLVNSPLYKFRNDTVNENDNLSYTGAARGNGIFGEEERWNNYETDSQRRLLIIVLISVLISIIVIFIIIRIVKKREQSLYDQKTHLEYVSQEIDLESFNLTPKEKEIFVLLLTDLTIKQIAHERKLSISGVNFHITNIYRKFGIQSRTELLVKFGKKIPAERES